MRARQYFVFFVMCIFLQGITLDAFARSSLSPDEQNTTEIFEKAAPFVVYVHRLRKVVNAAFDVFSVPAGTGSGILWSREGHVVTNYHVVYRAQDIAVTLGNGKTVRAKLLGGDRAQDIAVLQLVSTNELDYINGYSPITPGDSSKLLVGQKTIAIGNPFGLDRTLTTGVISALGRQIKGRNGHTIRDMIQTDASINPGNSGGPLLNSRGELIGMNTAMVSRSGSSSGIGFAVPSNILKRIVDQVIQYGKVLKTGLGIRRLDDRVARQLGVTGVVIGDVMAGTSAAKAGLRGTSRDEFGQLQIGDIITAIDNQRVRNFSDYDNILANKKIGQPVKISYIRNGKTKNAEVRLMNIGK